MGIKHMHQHKTLRLRVRGRKVVGRREKTTFISKSMIQISWAGENVPGGIQLWQGRGEGGQRRHLYQNLLYKLSWAGRVAGVLWLWFPLRSVTLRDGIGTISLTVVYSAPHRKGHILYLWIFIYL